jgi:hypothetical protein
MLVQRLDWRQRLQCLGAHPVISEFLGMEARPRPDEPQRARWKRPIENPQGGELDLSDLITVLGVEVRWRMIGTVHPDDDSVERGEARHRGIVGYSAADMIHPRSNSVTLLPGVPAGRVVQTDDGNG